MLHSAGWVSILQGVLAHHKHHQHLSRPLNMSTSARKFDGCLPFSHSSPSLALPHSSTLSLALSAAAATAASLMDWLIFGPCQPSQGGMRPTVAERATGCNRLRQAGQSETAIDESLRVGHTKTKKKKKTRTHKCVRLMSIVNVSGNRRKPNNSSKAICDSYCCSCTHTHTAIHTHTLHTL